MLNFILGGLFTLAVLAFGIVLGYFYGAREEKLEERKKKLRSIRIKLRNRGQQSGSVHPRIVTNADADAEERKPFTERFKELGGSEPPDDTIGFLEP